MVKKNNAYAYAKKKSTSKEKPTRQQKVDYSRFSAYERYTTDPKWKRIMQHLAKGILPENSSYDSESFTTSSGSVKLLPDVSDVNIMQNFLAIRALIEASDVKKTRKNRTPEEDHGEEEDAKDDVRWKSVKTKEAKNHLIHLYVKELLKYHEEDSKLTSKITAQMMLCLSLKLIDPTEIVMKDGKIYDIPSIAYDPDQQAIVFPKIKASKKTTTVKKKRNFIRTKIIDPMIKQNDIRLGKIIVS